MTPDCLGSMARRLSAIMISILAATSVPTVTHAQILATVIDRFRQQSTIPDTDEDFDARVLCILANNNGEEKVASSFEQGASVTLSQLDELLQFRPNDNAGGETGSEVEPGPSLRVGSYEDYGWRNALSLGLAPYTNPNALNTVATGYAVPGHMVILSSGSEDGRDEVIQDLLEGTVAATQYTAEGTYRRVGPRDPEWPSVVHAVRAEQWTDDTVARWEGDTLVVENDSREQDVGELRFIVVDDAFERSGNPVIAWDAGGRLRDVVREDYALALADYAQALIVAVDDTARDLECMSSNASDVSRN